MTGGINPADVVNCKETFVKLINNSKSVPISGGLLVKNWLEFQEDLPLNIKK